MTYIHTLCKSGLLLFVVSLTACSPSPQNSTSPQEKSIQANTLLSSAQGDKIQIQQALVLANEAVKQAPNDLTSLHTRAVIYLHLQQYNDALKDYRELNRLDETATNKLMECMLIEKTINSEYQDCYQQTSMLYVKENDAFGNILSRLFAEDESARLDAGKLIESTTSAELKEHYLFTLNNFDRKKYMDSILP